jgi:hypothetical protein
MEYLPGGDMMTLHIGKDTPTEDEANSTLQKLYLQ